MTSQLAVIAIVLSAACGGREPKSNGEEAYVAKELVTLRSAIATRNPATITTGCVIVTTSLSRMPAAMASEIEQLCFDDAPRVLLEAAVVEAKKDQASGLAQLDHKLTCYQLFAEDAFKWLAKRRAPSPALDAIAAEYEHLCPEKVASFRARAPTR